MNHRAAPYVLGAGQSRRDDAISPFKALASDTGGLLSAFEVTLGPWESGPVLHTHTGVDEAFYVVAGKLEAQLDDRRVQAGAGGFLWVPRGTAHSFANAGPEPVQVLALALPGGIEELFAEQAAYLSSVQGRPTPTCWPRSTPATALPPSGRRSAPRTPPMMLEARLQGRKRHRGGGPRRRATRGVRAGRPGLGLRPPDRPCRYAPPSRSRCLVLTVRRACSCSP